jgi:putative ABC transport system permease protein
MFKNHLKIALRNILKNKVFSAINIIGLAIGFSASFVIGVLIYYDLTFDKFHLEDELIYRITTDFKTPEGEFHNRGVAIPLGKTLKEGMVGIKLTSTFFVTYIRKIENKNADYVFKNPEDIIYADKEYFQLFSYKWLAGTSAEVLANPNEVVLTNSRAEKYFPSTPPQDVVGKTLIYNDSIPVKVVGVIANFKERSDFIFQEFLSLKTAVSFNQVDLTNGDEWDNTNSATQVFVKIASNSILTNVQERLDKLAKMHVDKEAFTRGLTRGFHLQPLSDIHLSPNYGVFDNSKHRASKLVLSSLAFVALFLLLLGCVNFINLNTAQATRRAKEIGIRKTLGSSKKQLIFQFLGETFLLTIAATIVSLFFSAWLLQLSSDFMPQGINFELFASPIMLVSIATLLLIVTLLSGFYPALVLSHFKPISVLKNQVLNENNRSTLRKYLTVFQFVIAQIFIIATILVGKQMNFIMAKDMGFKTEAIAFVRAWEDSNLNKRLNFMEEIKLLPQVSLVSLGSRPPASNSMSSSTTTYIKDGEKIYTNVELLFGDLNYRELYDIKLLAGRERLNDTIKEYVINETYSKLLGFKNPEDAIGQPLKVGDQLTPIVGVMEDFNQRSLRSVIQPMALVGDRYRSEHSQFNTIHFSLQGASENWPATVTEIETIWKTIYPEADFKLNFVDESVAQFYAQEQKTSVLLKWATGLAIIISCLGLLGLVIYTTERRTKEIGIRKVLGASLTQLNFLLCKEFLVLVVIAFVIAGPIAWWGLQHWLETFAYKTSLSWWVFLLSGMAMISIALAIMSIKTIASARANPVKSLRNE